MGMKISIQKTECQFLGEGSKKFRLEVEGQELKQTENFVYHGRKYQHKYVERRIGLARGTWQALGKVWNSKELSKATKTRIYEVLVLSTLLYNAETRTMKERQKQRLRVFKIACLRKIEGVTRRDRIRNEEIFHRLNIRIGIIDRIRNKRLRYFGHLNRMKNERYPQNSIQRICTWNQKEGKAKETMDRHDQRGLQRTASDTS